MIIKILVLSLLLPLSTFAFDWEKCSSQGLGDASIFGITTSSGQFTSSTGGCAAIGYSDKQKEFLALNSDSLKLDSSMGQGEYLSAYANLLGCSLKGTDALKTGLQTNYPMIWGQDSSKSPEEAHQAISSLIRADSILSKECSSSST